MIYSGRIMLTANNYLIDINNDDVTITRSSWIVSDGMAKSTCLGHFTWYDLIGGYSVTTNDVWSRYRQYSQQHICKNAEYVVCGCLSEANNIVIYYNYQFYDMGDVFYFKTVMVGCCFLRVRSYQASALH